MQVDAWQDGSSKGYARNLRTTLDILRKNLPRTFVNLVPMSGNLYDNEKGNPPLPFRMFLCKSESVSDQQTNSPGQVLETHLTNKPRRRISYIEEFQYFQYNLTNLMDI